MSERFSIRGKGAELFYGGLSQDAPLGDPTTARKKDNLPSDKTASTQGRLQDSKTARVQESNNPSTPTTPATQNPPADAVRKLREALIEDHPVNNTFRYSQESLDALRDVVYELEVKRDLKTSRNDIMRLGLAWIVDDYRANGANSLLVAVLKEERWKR